MKTEQLLEADSKDALETTGMHPARLARILHLSVVARAWAEAGQPTTAELLDDGKQVVELSYGRMDCN